MRGDLDLSTLTEVGCDKANRIEIPSRFFLRPLSIPRLPFGKVEKRKGRSIRSSLFESGSPSWARTNDLRINSPSLYRLSYRGMKKFLRTLSCGKLSGSPSWARTNDLRINSPSLYRLSYRGLRKHEYYRASQGFASLFVKNI